MIVGSGLPAGPAPPAASIDALCAALDVLEQAADFAKARYQVEVFRLAAERLQTDDGWRSLRAVAHRFEQAGVFHGGPWQRADRLVPRLVRGGLCGEGQYPTIEALSELRLLAIAAGEVSVPDMPAAAAQQFLRTVISLNIDLAFGSAPTEESRRRPLVYDRARRVLAAIASELPHDDLVAEVADEIEARAAQRPIQVEMIRQLIEQVQQLPAAQKARIAPRLAIYARACRSPTSLTESAGTLARYRDALRACDPPALAREAAEMAELLAETGLSNGFHAVLIRHARRSPELLAAALGLTERGRADLAAHPDLVRALVTAGIHPVTCDAIYGLSQLLDRALLSRREVAASLSRLAELSITSEARAALLEGVPRNAGVPAGSILLAGTLATLGQPLGVGQGDNPTCQAARALSLWSLHAPGYLLQNLTSACRDGTVEISFEGQVLSSRDIVPATTTRAIDLNLDPVSRVLVPHLDRIYAEMMRRAAGRRDDPHKWVNPALYGHWVRNGFVSLFDPTGVVTAHEQFVRLFYATHHPAYADEPELIYPNPIGILVTDVHGQLLGYHAVSIQRVAVDGEGELRIYFFNPNDEGRQNWGGGVEPTVHGHGEIPGESSLPFAMLAAHIYAFHYNPYEVGDGFAVPDEVVAEIGGRARSTWGREFHWL